MNEIPSDDQSTDKAVTPPSFIDLFNSIQHPMKSYYFYGYDLNKQKFLLPTKLSFCFHTVFPIHNGNVDHSRVDIDEQFKNSLVKSFVADKDEKVSSIPNKAINIENCPETLIKSMICDDEKILESYAIVESLLIDIYAVIKFTSFLSRSKQARDFQPVISDADHHMDIFNQIFSSELYKDYMNKHNRAITEEGHQNGNNPKEMREMEDNAEISTVSTILSNADVDDDDDDDDDEDEEGKYDK